MHIPRILGKSRLDHPSVRARRSPSARRFELERLEVRTALSSGLPAGPAAMDPYGASDAPALVGPEVAASTTEEAGIAVPATYRGTDAAPAAIRIGSPEDHATDLGAGISLTVESSPPIPLQYTNLLPVIGDLLTGLAGSIALVGQASRDGVPIPDLVEDVAAAIRTTPAKIPPALIPFGEAAAFTAQETGVAVPATIAGLEQMSGGSQIGGWISGDVGRIEALAAVDGSTSPNQTSIYGPPPALSSFLFGEGAAFVNAEETSGASGIPGPDPNAPPVPPALLPLGRFVLKNIDIIYGNYIQFFDNTSGSTASPLDGIALNGLTPVSDPTAAAVQEAQDAGWAGAGGTSYVMAFGRGLALSQVRGSQGGEVQGRNSSPEEAAPAASITAGAIPLDVLLSDPGSSTQDVSIGLQQVAELIPAEETSLALVATLWTVPSDSGAEPADGDDPSGERAEPVPASASPPQWAVFVSGLDDAIERSRGACRTTLSDGGRPTHGDGAADAAGDRLEWRWPIIPTEEARRRPGRPRESSPRIGLAVSDRAAPSPGADSDRPLPARPPRGEGLVAQPRPEDGSPNDAVGGQTLTEGAVRSVWAAGASALIAGWFWATRRRWRLGGMGRTDHRRGERHHSEGLGP